MHPAPTQQQYPSQRPPLQQTAYLFVLQPGGDDYQALAQHVVAAPQDRLHSSLWPQRARVAQSLHRMGQEPGREAHLAAYQALRLLVW